MAEVNSTSQTEVQNSTTNMVSSPSPPPQLEQSEEQQEQPIAVQEVVEEEQEQEQQDAPTKLITLLPPMAPAVGFQETETMKHLVSPEGVHVYLLGSAHISYKSVEEAQQLVRLIKPQVCFVEACARRKAILGMPIRRVQEPEPLTTAKMMQELQTNGTAALMQLVIANATMEMAKDIGIDVTPGTEFAAAAQEAQKHNGFIVLGDRDVNVTVLRAWRALTLYEKLVLLYGLIFWDTAGMTKDDIEKMKNSDVITEMMADLANEIPNLMEPLVYERDRFLLNQLRVTCKKMADLPNIPAVNGRKSIVAVVGMGHVAGIMKDWEKPYDEEKWTEEMRALTTIPPGPSWLQITFMSIVVPGAVIAGGVYLYRKLTK